MNLIFKNIANEFIKAISFKEFIFDQNFINKLNVNENLDKAFLISANEKISSWELEKLKLTL